MNTKIGFEVSAASNGLQTMKTINAGSWRRHLRDLTPVMNHIGAFARHSEGQYHYIAFVPEGTLVSIVSVLPGRDGDYIAGTIFLPDDLKITAGEIDRLLAEVSRQLQADSLDEEALDNIFGTEYPTTNAVHLMPVCEQAQAPLAYRRTGQDVTLGSLLAPARRQDYYSQYQGLLAVGDGVEVTGADDLTARELKTYGFMYPPVEDEVKRLGNGTTFKLEDGSEFNHPVRRELGATVTVVASKNGADPMTLTDKLVKDGDHFRIDPKMRWEKTIGRDQFNFVDSTSQPIQNVSVYINGEKLNKSLTLKLEQAENADVRFACKGYEEIKEKRDLRSLPHTITMRRHDDTYKRLIRLSNGELADITIVHREPLAEGKSPLRGYKAKDDGLHYAPAAPWLPAVLGAVVGFVLCFGILWLTGVCSKSEQNPGAPVPATQPANTNTPVAKPEPFDSTEYRLSVDEYKKQALKHNLTGMLLAPVWSKKDMDKHPELAGLFDAVNYRDRAATDSLLAKLPKTYVTARIGDKMFEKRTLIPMVNDGKIDMVKLLTGGYENH